VSGLHARLLESVGVEHAFGLRDEAPLPDVVRPTQVHGVAVAFVEDGGPAPGDADAIVSGDSGYPVGIVTADCVPVLATAADGRTVAAIHAGWRGLASGVVEAGVRALQGRSGCEEPAIAVIGPHIGACCYEVDEPVIGPLRERFGDAVDDATRAVRAGHWMLDLGALVDLDLERAGLPQPNRGCIRDACTCCDPDRFHSYRRDGAEAGRLLHHIRVKRGS
jgi:hypothetical protein